MFLSHDAAAQTTRAELIAEGQAAKAAVIHDEGPGRAEQIVTRASGALTGAPVVGPYPWFGSIADGAGFGAGAGYRQPLAHYATVQGVAGVAVRGSRLFEATLGLLPGLAGGRVSTTVTARRVDASGLAFHGTGPDSRLEDRTRYEARPRTLGVQAVARPFDGLTVGAGYDRLAIDTRPDGSAPANAVLGNAAAFGADLLYDVVRLDAGLDWRPAAGYSTRGGFVRLGWDRYGERRGQPYGFTVREIEAAQLVPLVGGHYVLAFRALGTFSRGHGTDAVPFVLAPYLGSGSTLRGFRNRRFVDDTRVLLTGEYRWMASRYLDMAVFTDIGQVAPEHRQLRLSGFERTVGIGARLHGPSFNVLRVEAARGREGWALALAAAQPF